MFAIGRSVSRFRSYGYAPQCESVAVCSWPQFVRLRYEIRPTQNVFRSLHAQIRTESIGPTKLKAIPHEMVVAGQKVLFENLWNGYDDPNDT